MNDMRRQRKAGGGAGRAAALGVAAILAAAGAAAVPLDRAGAIPWSGWSKLRLEARTLLLFWGQVEMRVSGPVSGRRLIETRTRATFLGAELADSRTITTMDAASGRTVESVDLSRKRGRRYVFDDGGYTVEKLRPKPGVTSPQVAPLDRWEVVSRRRFAHSAPIHDYYAMIYHLRELKLGRVGQEATLTIATSDGPQPYRIRVSEVRSASRVFEDLRTGRPWTSTVRELRLRITPADPSRAEEGFLRMEGETEIWIESGSGTLLEVDGSIPKVPGRIEVRIAGLG